MGTNYLIPPNWELIRVSEAGELLRGVNYKKEHSSYEGQENYLPVLRANNINSGELNFENLVFVEKKYISETQLLKTGDIVFAMSSGSKHLVGKTAKAKSDFHGGFGAFCAVFRPIENFDKDFIAYFFQSPTYKNLIRKIGQGTNIINLKREHILDLDFPLPPLPEQHRIVSKIEQLFTDLDKGIEYLKTAQQQLKVYRQAVLKWAFEGKLTNENVADGELPQDWKWFKLNALSKVTGGITKNGIREKHKLKLPFLRVANVYFNSLDLSELHTIGLEEKEIERARLEIDDLIFVEGNGSIEQIGRVALWNGAIKNCVHQNHLIKARLFKSVFPKYALHFFCSKVGRDKIKIQASSSSGLHTLSLGKIQKLELPLCSLKEQKIIVQEIESRLSVCDKIEEAIETSLLQAEALRLSILKKAFEGKLVSQNPGDEPAEKLLERIRDLRQAQGKQGKAKPEKKEKVRAEKKPTQKRKEKIEI